MNLRQKTFLLRQKPILNCKLKEHEHSVQSGLAVTPAQMLDMTSKGLAVAPGNLPENMFSDTDHTGVNDFSVNSDERRGTDINVMWEERQQIKKKFREAHESAKQFMSNMPDLKGGE